MDGILNTVFEEALFLFSEEQLEQIEKGLKDGLSPEQVQIYAKLCYTPRQMSKKRKKLLKKKG